MSKNVFLNAADRLKQQTIFKSTLFLFKKFVLFTLSTLASVILFLHYIKFIVPLQHFNIVVSKNNLKLYLRSLGMKGLTRKYKGGSIIVPLTSCLTGLN